MTANDQAGGPKGTICAIDRIADAGGALRRARSEREDAAIADAEAELRAAIDAAVYGLDVSWQAVGDALGIMRGNAYQQFRRRPTVDVADAAEHPAGDGP